MAEDNNSTEYAYTPITTLHSIRLLELHPATSESSPLEVSLREFSLDACPQFGALSYTWATEDGDSSLSKRLRCRGAFIRTTANCEAALVRLRRKHEVHALWVDAVCIDQSNDEEKSLQIALMRHIYSQATWVGLWVGEASSLSDMGMAFLHDFAVEIAERSNSGQDVREGLLYQEFIQDRRAFLEQGFGVFTPRVQGLWDVLHRRWWHRLWVVQELSLAKSPVLICGRKAESFENLRVVARVLLREEQSVEEFEFSTSFLTPTFHHIYMRDFAALRQRQADGEPFEPRVPGETALEILNVTRNARAADPRDKIYGILGFFGDPESDPENIFPLPDYTKTAAEVYAEVSRTIIKNTRTLDIMSSCHGFVRTSVPDLPSWAAAWNDSPIQYFDQVEYKAASDSSVIYQESVDPRLLTIKGQRIDSVKYACQASDEFEYTNHMRVQLWRQWTDLALSLTSSPTGESIADVLMDTLCWGSNFKFDRLAPGEYQETFDAWLKILKSTDPLEAVAKDIFDDPVAHKYAHRITSLTWGRCMGTTAKSYLAMLPMSAAEGDQIVIFNGGRMPFVLNPKGDNYTLVGPCYIHGIMDGEAFSKDVASDELEWFTLC